MTWSVSASGTAAEVKQKVREQVKEHSRVAAAICELVDCAGTAAHVSLTGHGSETDAGNVVLSITKSAPPKV